MPTPRFRPPTAKQLHGLRTRKTFSDGWGSTNYDVLLKDGTKIGEVYSGSTAGWTYADYTGKTYARWGDGQPTMNDALDCVYGHWQQRPNAAQGEGD